MNCESAVVVVLVAAASGDVGSGTAAAAVAVGVGTVLEAGAFDAVDARVGGDDVVAGLLLLLLPGVDIGLETQSESQSESGTCRFVSRIQKGTASRPELHRAGASVPEFVFVHHH